jgi:hypothetical protein
MTTSANPSPKKHAGGCHCGAVRFEVDLDVGAGGNMCNCSVCTKIAGVGAIVKPAAFRLVSGEDSLSTYEWGARISQRKFCKHCGVHCFAVGYLEQIGGDYVGVKLNCLDDFDLAATAITYWDGRHDNWMGGTRDKPWPTA